MKKLFFLSFSLATLLIAVSCGNSSKTELAGSVTSKYLEGKSVYLYSMLLDSMVSKGPILKDSSVVKNGKFSFKVSLDADPSLGLVSFNKDNTPEDAIISAPQAFVVLEKGKITLAIDSNRVVLSGTSRNEILNTVHHAVNNQLLDINDEVIKAGDISLVPLDVNGKDVQDRMRDISKDTKKKMYAFLKDNMDNQVGAMLFWDMAQDLSARQKLDLITLGDTTFQKRQEVLEAKQYLGGLLERENRLLGSNYKEATLLNVKGQNENLSKHLGKGQYTLLFFWNTQSPVCLQQMAYLSTLYAANKDKKFEIVGISLEKDKKNFDEVMTQLAAIRELNNVTWVQLFDQTHSAVAAYEIAEVPYTLLFDTEGKAIGVNLPPFELEEKLEEVLN